MNKLHGILVTILISFCGQLHAASLVYNIDTQFQFSHRNGTGNYNPPGGHLSGHFTIDTSAVSPSSSITELSLVSLFPNPYGGAPILTTTYNYGVGGVDDNVSLSNSGGNSVLTVVDNHHSYSSLRLTLTLNFLQDLMNGPTSTGFIPYEKVQKYVPLGLGSWGWQGPGRSNNPTVSKAYLDASSVSTVPIPSAALMFAPALLGFMGLRRKVKI